MRVLRERNVIMAEERETSAQLEFNRRLKRKLKADILEYRERYPKERDALDILAFIEAQDNLFGRDSLAGHITCSAWIVDGPLDQAVLVRHRRLARWVQPGGHIEAMETPFQAAAREAAEETGLQGLIPWSQELFHLSVHRFPEGKDGPAHFHYDLRYLFLAPGVSELPGSAESDGVKWVRLDELQDFSDEATILDMAGKTRALAGKGAFNSAAEPGKAGDERD